MKITKLIPEKDMKKLPVTFRFFRPIDKEKVIFITPNTEIKKYGTIYCNVYPSVKPISKII